MLVKFTKGGCIFQDLITEDFVALGTRAAGLYKFHADIKGAMCKSVVSQNKVVFGNVSDCNNVRNQFDNICYTRDLDIAPCLG